MKQLPVLGLVLLLAACTGSRPRVQDRMQPATGAAAYFANDSTAARAADALFVMKEPTLNGYTGKGDFIRLLWLPTFSNLSVTRINKFDDVLYANYKEMRLDGVVVRDTLIVLQDKAWKDLPAQLTETIPQQTPAEDGITWYLESRINGKYQVRSGWDDGSATGSILQSMLKIR
ncbi:hypothetical protein MKQ68_09880 [Chitinophaga horti]|uniref:Lipoprotein n=1 Tax=Chitinophaga horti TaxID=2920382 RepID=A0ABY6J6W0_9BACT|nr:hypothetical protein [Chitinophaga horti]UYQ95406.1 hypothetical protein MKQ68_09880 [Chitinophaga horti]